MILYFVISFTPTVVILACFLQALHDCLMYFFYVCIFSVKLYVIKAFYFILNFGLFSLTCISDVSRTTDSHYSIIIKPLVVSCNVSLD